MIEVQKDERLQAGVQREDVGNCDENRRRRAVESQLRCSCMGLVRISLVEKRLCIRVREDNSVKASTAIGVVGNVIALLRLVPGRIQSSFEAVGESG